MFDIGFFELVVVAVVALLVLGPERLPHAVRMAGAFMGKARRMMANVRDEFEREVQLSEMQQRIKEQLEKSGLEDARKALEDTKRSIEDTHSILSQDVAGKPAAPEVDPDTRHSEPSPENAAPAPPAETFPVESEPQPEPQPEPSKRS